VVLANLQVQLVDDVVDVLARLPVLAAVEHPRGDVVVGRVLDHLHQPLDLLRKTALLVNIYIYKILYIYEYYVCIYKTIYI